MKPIHLTAILLLSFGTISLADEQGDRQKLIGSWQMQGGAESSATSWTFSTAKNSLRVMQQEGANTVMDFACSTEGTSCETKNAGKKAMVSMWFNGSSLVEMETKGSEVVKRRFKVLPQEDGMEMEVIPIVPSGKTETFQFKRAQLAARKD
jgi:hypothetical protein